MKLSKAQRRVLKNLYNGMPADFGLSGRSRYGGFTKTMSSLRRRGFLDYYDNLTDIGRELIAAELGGSEDTPPGGGK